MRDVPADGGPMGEVVMRGNNVMRGYFEDPEATVEAFEGGWFHSGDLGVVHPDGYIELRDRKKDIIISGGENIASVEIEKVIQDHSAVFEVVVIGVPDEQWGEAVKAIVVLQPGAEASPEDIIAYAKTQIAGFKVPKSIDYIDVLPRNPSGKVLRRELRAPYWEGRERNVN